MIQIQIVIKLKEGKIQINQLAREDVTPDEREYAQALETTLMALMQTVHAEAGDELEFVQVIK